MLPWDLLAVSAMHRSAFFSHTLGDAMSASLCDGDAFERAFLPHDMRFYDPEPFDAHSVSFVTDAFERALLLAVYESIC